MNSKRIIKKVGNNPQSSFLVEVSNVEIENNAKKNDLSPVSVSNKIEEVADSLNSLIDKVSSSVLQGIFSNKNKPSKIGVEFNVELSAEGGLWFIAKGEAKTGLTVSLEWELPTEETSEG